MYYYKQMSGGNVLSYVENLLPSNSDNYTAITQEEYEEAIAELEQEEE